MKLVKIQGTSFVKDIETNTLINQDSQGLTDYLNRRNILASQKNEINTIKSEVDSIKSDIKEIKDLMLKILEKG